MYRLIRVLLIQQPETFLIGKNCSRETYRNVNWSFLRAHSTTFQNSDNNLRYYIYIKNDFYFTALFKKRVLDDDERIGSFSLLLERKLRNIRAYDIKKNHAESQQSD